ncbi:MAG: hypothetical protein KKE20_07305 [Nanoarchaeota archaeon]|nr:hypothetical protein [Nanoarchaeota archaeon]
MADSVFRGALVFLDEIGIYDVVLPFLLVFAIVFAILEKTKVLGVEKLEGVEYTKKSINAIVAFVIGFLVIISTKLVGAINEAMANIVLLLLVSISFLLLIGSFFHYEEKVFLEKGVWRTFFMIIMFIAVLLIFLQAIKTDSGDSWLETFWNFLSNNWATNYTASIILMVVVIVVILFITHERKPDAKAGKEEG